MILTASALLRVISLLSFHIIPASKKITNIPEAINAVDCGFRIVGAMNHTTGKETIFAIMIDAIIFPGSFFLKISGIKRAHSINIVSIRASKKALYSVYM
jgi:hypothetical protein